MIIAWFLVNFLGLRDVRAGASVPGTRSLGDGMPAQKGMLRPVPVALPLVAAGTVKAQVNTCVVADPLL